MKCSWIEIKYNQMDMWFILIKRNKNTELIELLGSELVGWVTKMGRLRWFGRVECNDDADWVKWCMAAEIEGTRQRGRQKSTWWNCVRGITGEFSPDHEDA